MSNFDRPSESISQSWASLQSEWDAARSQWQDQVAGRFERDYWSEWQSTLPQALNVLRIFEDVTTQAIQATRLED